MGYNGPAFKPGDVFRPKDYFMDANAVLIVIGEKTDGVKIFDTVRDHLPLYTVLRSRDDCLSDLAESNVWEDWLAHYYQRKGHINIANYNKEDLKDILEGILRKATDNEFKADAILRLWNDPEFELRKEQKGEETMDNAFYKVGDILEFPGEKETYDVLRLSMSRHGYEKVRCLILGIFNVGFDTYVYEFIVKTESSELYYQRNAHQRQICTLAKRIGHVDISMLEFKDKDKDNSEQDHQKLFAAYACVEASNLRKMNAALSKENKELKAEIEKLKKENTEHKQSLDEEDKKITNMVETRYHIPHTHAKAIVDAVRDLECFTDI